MINKQQICMYQNTAKFLTHQSSISKSNDIPTLNEKKGKIR